MRKLLEVLIRLVRSEGERPSCSLGLLIKSTEIHKSTAKLVKQRVRQPKPPFFSDLLLFFVLHDKLTS